ncbi:hypothetical protein BH10PSE19_BH10PSE19_03420 [soil metagenome]
MNTSRIFHYALLSFFGLSSMNAMAVDTSSPGAPPAGAIDVNVIRDPDVTRAINNLIAGYGHDKIEQLYPKRADEDPIKNLSKIFTTIYPDKVTGPLAPNSAPNKEINNEPFMPDLSTQAIYDMLTTINPKQTTGQILNKVAAPDYAHACEKPTFNNGQYQCPSVIPVNLNMDSLVHPTQYDTDQQASANNFIRYITGLASPPAALDFGKLETKDRDAALKDGKVQQYLLGLRTLAAMSSVGISNLYYLYAERLPIKMDNPNPKDNRKQIEISPLQAQQEMASRRLRDPEWIAKMDAASPAVVARETLYLLAEMRFEMFQNRMVNERIMAAQAVIQIQNASATPQALQLPQQFTEITGAPPFTPKAAK